MYRLCMAILLIAFSYKAVSNPRSDLKVLLEQERAGGATNPVLMHEISKAYSLLGGSANLALSYEYMVKAAELGHPAASFELYEAVKSGLQFNGVNKNRNNPAYWLGMAANSGHAEAQLRMAQIKLRSDEEQTKAQSLKVLMDMANQGNPNAILALAEVYIDGVYVEQDINKGVELVNSYNEQHEAGGEGFYLLSRAKFELGDEKGRLQALNKSALLGNANASFELGVILSSGDLNSRVQAEKHLKVALSKGFKQAESYLTEIQNKNNSPILYNINLYRADRELVRQRLQSAGIKLVSSKGYLDYFEGGELNGAYQLIAAYHVKGSHFTLAQLSFRFVGDNNKLEELSDALNKKYAKEVIQSQSRRHLRKNLLASMNRSSWKKGSVFIRLEKDVGQLDEMRLEYIIEPFASQMSELLDKAKRSGAESGQLLTIETI